jgi:hypothetical protein
MKRSVASFLCLKAKMDSKQFSKQVLDEVHSYPCIRRGWIDPDIVPVLVAPVKQVMEWIPRSLEGLDLNLVQTPLSAGDKCHVFECNGQSAHWETCIAVEMSDAQSRLHRVPTRDQIISRITYDQVICPFQTFRSEHQLMGTNIACTQMSRFIADKITELAGQKTTCFLHGTRVWLVVPPTGTRWATLEFKVFFSFA